jgi:hypothetical protein
MDRHMARARAQGSRAWLGLSSEAGWEAVVSAAYARFQQDHWAAGSLTTVKASCRKGFCVLPWGRSWSRTRDASFADRCVVLGVASNFVGPLGWSCLRIPATLTTQTTRKEEHADREQWLPLPHGGDRRADESLPALARELFAIQAKEYTQLQTQIDEIDTKFMAWHRADE